MVLTILIEAFTTFFLTGLIWTIQKVHYPSFHFVDERNYLSFQDFHMNSISWIVAPVMFIELIIAGYNLYIMRDTFFLINFSVVILLWANTFFWNMPLHRKLTHKKELSVIRELVLSNWPRTFLWSLKSLLLLMYLSRL